MFSQAASASSRPHARPSTSSAHSCARNLIRKGVAMNNEQIIRRAYDVAEKVDIKGWVECFTPDGTFTDMAIGATYRGPDGPTGLGKTVEVYATAFPDMHREVFRIFTVGDIV